jgi:hypothetical protein
MTRRPASADELLREMQSSVVPVDAPDAVRNRRARTIAHLRDTQVKVLGERDARNRRKRAAIAAAALIPFLAAGFALYAGQRHPTMTTAVAPAEATMVRSLEGHVVVFHGTNATETVSDVGTHLAAGDAVHTRLGSRATMTMPSRATIDLGPATDVHLGAPEPSRGEWIDLALGRVDVSVPKLDAGKSLSVRTPKATVTVHGTRFSVVVSRNDDHVETVVAVSEGAVWVEHDGQTTQLGSGARWSSRAAATSESGAKFEAKDIRATTQDGSESSRGAMHGATRQPLAAAANAGKAPNALEFAPLATSSLSEENSLMERAMMASRRGDDRSAVAILDKLLTRFPHSILKENAQVERSRALQRLGDSSGAAQGAQPPPNPQSP